MKIIHVGPAALPISFTKGGAIERRVIEMAQLQGRQGHEVFVYSAGDADQELDDCDFRSCILKCSRRGRIRNLEFLAKVGRRLRHQSMDIIHFHGMPEGIWFLRRHQARKVLSYDYFRNRRWTYFPIYDLYRWTMKQYDCLLPVSQFCLEESSKFWNIPADHMRILHNGVNTNQFAPDPAAAEAMARRLGLANTAIVLCVGRVCEQKGTDLLLDAYGRLKAKMPEVQLVVVGPAESFGSNSFSPLVRRIQDVGGRYLGAVEESDLASTYNLASVCVLPTRRDEMFGMAAVEAQACGKAVICSDSGGLPEVIPDTSGIIFPSGDSKALALALERVLADRQLLFQLSSAARKNAMRFSWEAIVDEAQYIYEMV